MLRPKLLPIATNWRLERRLFVNAINIAERGADFAQGSVSADRFDRGRHCVLVVLGCLLEFLEGVID